MDGSCCRKLLGGLHHVTLRPPQLGSSYAALQPILTVSLGILPLEGKVPVLTKRIAPLGVCLVLGLLGALTFGSQAAASDQVVVPRGSAVQIAVVLPFTGFAAVSGEGAWNGVRLAVEKQSRIKGFAVQLNRFNGPCGPDDGLNVLAANQVVANPQNVAVIGHFCSNHFSEALPVYQAAGIVTLSGSATSPILPSMGPDVFNDVAIKDACCPFQDLFDPWYDTVSHLPRDLFWRQQDYRSEFGTPPPAFADLYYDATSLLLTKIASTASLDGDGSLVIDRAVLAQAVRTTAAFDGVTCDITLASNGFRVDDPVSLSKCASTGWQHGLGALVTPHRIDDRFSAPSIDRSVWQFGTNQPDQITLSEGAGHVTVNVSGDATNDFNVGLGTLCSAHGDFDAQVSFNLVAWPASDGVWVSLMASGTPFNTYRASASWFDSYGAYLPPIGDVVPATGSSGTLRLARKGSQWTGSYLADHRWVAIASGVGPTVDLGLTIAVFNISNATAFGGQPATVEFNDFHLFANGIVCS